MHMPIIPLSTTVLRGILGMDIGNEVMVLLLSKHGSRVMARGLGLGILLLITIQAEAASLIPGWNGFLRLRRPGVGGFGSRSVGGAHTF